MSSRVLTTAEQSELDKWNLGNLPPEGHKDVGRVFNRLWEAARKEKIDKLQMHERFLDLHSLWRGRRDKRKSSKYPKWGMNYLFKTVRGYCATLTEKVPQFEFEADDAPAELLEALGEDTKSWWNEYELQDQLFASVQNMCVYGTTIEKGVFNAETDESENILKDPFCIFPAPGGKMCNTDKLPYICDIDFLEPWEIRSRFSLEDAVIIPTDGDLQLIGSERETVKGGSTSKRWFGSHLSSTYSEVPGRSNSMWDRSVTLVVEIWVRDRSTRSEPVFEDVDIEIQNPDGTVSTIVEQKKVGTKKVPVYPGGIRKVVICPALIDSGSHPGVLDDCKNPNINWGLKEARISRLVEWGIDQPVIDPETQQPVIQNIPIDRQTAEDMIERKYEKMYLYRHFPFLAVPFYFDTSQWWAFSGIEVLEELQGKGEKLLNKYIAYLERMMFPILILPQGCGVTKRQITNEIGLVIEPNPAAAPAIRYLELPRAPRELIEAVQMLLMQHDIMGGSPEVTEGRRPKGISAASAITALQDKAATLYQPLIRQVDKIVRNRGRMRLSFLMNFGTKENPVKVDSGKYNLQGTNLDGTFDMLVESGSSAPVTKAGRRQQYIELFGMGALDLETLLTRLEIPDASTIVERLTEQNSLPGAIDILIQSGMPEEEAMQLYQMLMQPQGGTGRGKPGSSGQQKPGPSRFPRGSNRPESRAQGGQANGEMIDGR